MYPDKAWIEATRARNRAKLGMSGLGAAPSASSSIGGTIASLPVVGPVLKWVLAPVGAGLAAGLFDGKPVDVGPPRSALVRAALVAGVAYLAVKAWKKRRKR